MNDRLRRVLLIIAFVVVVGVLAFALYYLFFRQLAAPPVTGPGGVVTPGGTLPGAGPSGALPTSTQPTGPGGLPVTPGQPFNPQLPSGVTTPSRTTVLRQEITSDISMS